MKILITGSAGFIGFHTTKFFLDKGYDVVGIDNLNHYYDVKLKKARNAILLKYKNYYFKKININSFKEVKKIFSKNKFDFVLHLAAQAGVRYSLKNPESYIDTNLKGFFNVIENCKRSRIKKFIYASSSSVYGLNKNRFFSESDSAVNPIQLYAATKRANELIAHAYSCLYKIKTTGLRFFTVYGPWGRPDMSLFLFTEKILNKKKIDIFNNGDHYRDFTYIDDIVRGIFLSTKNIEKFNYYKESFFNIFNIASGRSIKLTKFIELIEKKLNLKAIRNYKKIQKGDIIRTSGSIKKIRNILGYKPKVDIQKGINNFIEWYLDYNKK